MDRKIVLLDHFKDDEMLLELLDLVRLNQSEDMEKFYYANGRYPEQRDMLAMLKFELKVRKAGSTSQ